MATLSRTGSSFSAWAIEGSAVEMIVESRFSMNSAHATIMGIRNWRGGRGMADFFLAATGRTGQTRMWVQHANLPQIACRDLRCRDSCHAFAAIANFAGNPRARAAYCRRPRLWGRWLRPALQGDRDLDDATALWRRLSDVALDRVGAGPGGVAVRGAGSDTLSVLAQLLLRARARHHRAQSQSLSDIS